MDDEVVRFRRAAERENREGRAIRRRYSRTLQQQAVDYCQARRQQGGGVRAIAASLGIAPWSLHRWMRRLPPRSSFRAIALTEPAVVAPGPSVMITMTATGPRVEGLTVEMAAQLLTLLRRDGLAVASPCTRTRVRRICARGLMAWRRW